MPLSEVAIIAKTLSFPVCSVSPFSPFLRISLSHRSPPGYPLLGQPQSVKRYGMLCFVYFASYIEAAILIARGVRSIELQGKGAAEIILEDRPIPEWLGEVSAIDL